MRGGKEREEREREREERRDEGEERGERRGVRGERSGREAGGSYMYAAGWRPGYEVMRAEAWV